MSWPDVLPALVPSRILNPIDHAVRYVVDGGARHVSTAYAASGIANLGLVQAYSASNYDLTLPARSLSKWADSYLTSPHFVTSVVVSQYAVRSAQRTAAHDPVGATHDAHETFASRRGWTTRVQVVGRVLGLLVVLKAIASVAIAFAFASRVEIPQSALVTGCVRVVQALTPWTGNGQVDRYLASIATGTPLAVDRDAVLLEAFFAILALASCEALSSRLAGGPITLLSINLLVVSASTYYGTGRDTESTLNPSEFRGGASHYLYPLVFLLELATHQVSYIVLILLNSRSRRSEATATRSDLTIQRNRLAISTFYNLVTQGFAMRRAYHIYDLIYNVGRMTEPELFETQVDVHQALQFGNLLDFALEMVVAASFASSLVASSLLRRKPTLENYLGPRPRAHRTDDYGAALIKYTTTVLRSATLYQLSRKVSLRALIPVPVQGFMLVIGLDLDDDPALARRIAHPQGKAATLRSSGEVVIKNDDPPLGSSSGCDGATSGDSGLRRRIVASDETGTARGQGFSTEIEHVEVEASSGNQGADVDAPSGQEVEREGRWESDAQAEAVVAPTSFCIPSLCTRPERSPLLMRLSSTLFRIAFYVVYAILSSLATAPRTLASIARRSGSRSGSSPDRPLTSDAVEALDETGTAVDVTSRTEQSDPAQQDETTVCPAEPTRGISAPAALAAAIASHLASESSPAANLSEADKERKRQAWTDSTSAFCVVCTVEPRTIILWPCRCLALCEYCRNALAQKLAAPVLTSVTGVPLSNGANLCPTCRKDVEGYSQIHIP
ncbi:hypothetical protein JCM10212_002830 [Sporobolomyces blumeae]